MSCRNAVLDCRNRTGVGIKKVSVHLARAGVSFFKVTTTEGVSCGWMNAREGELLLDSEASECSITVLIIVFCLSLEIIDRTTDSTEKTTIF